MDDAYDIPAGVPYDMTDDRVMQNLEALNRFMRAVAGMSSDQWHQLAAEFASMTQVIAPARESMVRAAAKLATGKLLPPSEAKGYVQAAQASREQAAGAMRSLPESSAVDGQTLPVRELATQATLSAWQAITVAPWLQTEQERTSAGTLLSPFSRYIELPRL